MKKTVWIVVLCLCTLIFASCNDSGNSKAESGKLTDVHEAVKKAYGENYLPSMDLGEEYLKEVVGLDMADVKEFVAEGPMISAHIDLFIGVEAAEGKAAAVEEKLKQYLDAQIENMVTYPMNMPKLKASQVVRVDDYVFYVCLGAYDDDATDEAQAQKFYEEQVKIGIQAIHDTLGK